tara:strand:- start:169 stop:306 length:138 start_codon:yes stop_codon:yes gene_type:complete
LTADFYKMHRFLSGICAKQTVFLVFEFDVKLQLQRLKGESGHDRT